MDTAVPVTHDRQCLHETLQLLHVFIRQTHSLAVCFNSLALVSSRDWNGALTDDPSDSYLRSGPVFALRKAFDGLYELCILLESVGLEASKHVAEVARW